MSDVFTSGTLTVGQWIELHAKHVAELRNRFDQIFRRFSQVSSIVIHGGKSNRCNSRDDRYWPTVVTPFFKYWTPYVETPALLVIRPSEVPTLYIEKHNSFWEGPAPVNPRWSRDSFSIVEIHDLKASERFENCIYIGDEEECAPKGRIVGDTFDDVLRSMDLLRTQKTEFEVASIKEATWIAGHGHRRLREKFMSGVPVSEIDLHYDYLMATKQTDFSEPYGDIVALGTNAAILHHVHYGRANQSTDTSLLLDAGASCNGYASDITRTWVRGSSSQASKFRELLYLMETVQQDLCKKFIVGTEYQSLHNLSHEKIAGVIRDIKLSTASVEELVTSGATRCLFPHGLGHSLGLQVHDVGMRFTTPEPRNPGLRNTATVDVGQVVTVEPGLYFIESLLTKLKGLAVGATFDWALVDVLQPFGGIRIEDNILATASGPVNLTRDWLADLVGF
jgi:Xaa-Pro dipeptidase